MFRESKFANKKESLQKVLFFFDRQFMEKTKQDYKGKTIVVNLIGGPGTGKSIITSDIFSKLKRNFVSADISPEYIKKKIREGSIKAVQSQIYIFGKQQYQLFTMKDEVDVIITDSPLILSSVYDVTNCSLLKALVLDEFGKYDNMIYYINRDKSVPYEQEGRYQDSEGAKKVDESVLGFLSDNDIDFKVVNGIGEDTLETIVGDVMRKLTI